MEEQDTGEDCCEIQNSRFHVAIPHEVTLPGVPSTRPVQDQSSQNPGIDDGGESCTTIYQIFNHGQTGS